MEFIIILIILAVIGAKKNKTKDGVSNVPSLTKRIVQGQVVYRDGVLPITVLGTVHEAPQTLVVSWKDGFVHIHEDEVELSDCSRPEPKEDSGYNRLIHSHSLN